MKNQYSFRKCYIDGNIFHGEGLKENVSKFLENNLALASFMSDLNHLGYHFEYHMPGSDCPGVSNVWKNDSDNLLPKKPLPKDEKPWSLKKEE